jgi:hypothetical protein
MKIIKMSKDYRENWKFSILREHFFHSSLDILLHFVLNQKSFYIFDLWRYINFKGTGIFDLKRTNIFTHTFAWSEVIDKIEFWSCLYCVESVCITCGSEVNKPHYPIIAHITCTWMHQYENYKNAKGLQRKLEVLYPKRTVLSLVIRHLITYYLIKNAFTFTFHAGI